MAVMKFIVGNLKRRKSYSVVICILVFLTGIILTVTTSTMRTAGDAFDQAYSKMEGPHLLYWFENEEYKQEFGEWFESSDQVESVKLRQAFLYNGSILQKNGIVLKNMFDYNILTYNPEDKMRLIDSKFVSEKLLSPGEIYLPYIYKTSGDVVVGDSIDLVFGNQKISLKVVGFIEELIVGGELDDAKFIYLSQEDIDELVKLGGKNGSLYQQLRVRLITDDDATSYQLAKDFMKDYGTDIGYVKRHSEIKNNLLILPNIALVVMVSFAIILCSITITIMRYAILATIEADYTNIGIVKALGFTPFMVQISITGLYAFLALLAGGASLFGGLLVTPFLGQIILNSSGIFFEDGRSLGQGIVTILGLIFIISLFSLITARHTKKISPICAITNGFAPVYFSARINARLETLRFLPFDSCMAVKQVLTKSKRYILLMAISAILAYALKFSFELVDVFGSEKALGMLGADFADIEIDTHTKEEATKLVAQIKADYEVEWAYFENSVQIEVEEERTVINIREDFEVTGVLKTLEGRFPKHDNEVMITSLLKERYGKSIGDYLLMKDSKGGFQNFMITGVFQTIEEGGAVIMMHESGMKALNPDFELNEVYLKLKSHENLDETIHDMQAKYTGYEEISNERQDSVEKIDTIKKVFSAISKLVLVLTIIMISVITLLMMKITIYGETKEMGIYKAIGFSSFRLRVQLAQRFVMITLLGGAFGIFLETLWGAKLFSYALRFAGISSFSIEFQLIYALLPMMIISTLALISSYISSGNTKRVSAYRLISE